MRSLFFILCILQINFSFCQAIEDPFRYNKNDIILYNIGIGAIFGGVGALVNKKENEEWHKVFLKGFGQGALGGYVVYESKNILSQISKQQDLSYALYAKGVNSIGVSIIENATSNRNFWEVWHINFGFNRFEFHTEDNFKFHYKFMPISFVFSGYLLFNYNFRFRETMQTGEFVFRGDVRSKYNDNIGFAFGNSLVYDSSLLNTDRFYTLISHEIVHVYQNYDFNPINSILDYPVKKLTVKNSFLKKINPYIKYDFNLHLFLSIYNLEAIKSGTTPNNFFEFEAYYFSKDLDRFR